MLKTQRDDFVNVSLRIRPSESRSCLQIISEQPPILLISDKRQTYCFDNIFTQETTNQQIIYNETVAPLVEHVKIGYDCTVFAYGQTGTGKTYTIGTDPKIDNVEDAGLIPRTLEDFFTSHTKDTEISISFIEIYNEKVFDLLSNEVNVPLVVKGFNVQGYLKRRIYSKELALTYLEIGCKNRHTGETKQNLNSSRSHAIFTIHYNDNNSESKLNLVDLAGSESVKKTGNRGSSFQEGININKGLLSLGQVITALSSNLDHIPYRQSIITTILHDSLNKRNFISLIACVSSDIDDIGETCHTLDFATRVKKMRNKPEINQIIHQYRNENPDLFQKTPMKRSITTQIQSYETPFKRPRCLPIVTESSPKSVSILTATTTETLQDFSPVIKKYMNAMEDSLMNRLKNVLESTTVQQPSRRKSSRLKNKENRTTEFTWDKLRNIIRQEIVQMTGQSSRSTSSPLMENNEILGRRLFDNPPTPDDNNNDGVVFKKPAPIKKSKRNDNPVKRRCSVRLQVKHQQHVPEQEITIIETCNRRKSVRLLLKNSQHVESEITVQKQNEKVLNILNTGTVRDLQKLHTVGPKTAQTIVFFRQLKGGFQAISDLSEMPQWTQTKYERFCLQNFITS